MNRKFKVGDIVQVNDACSFINEFPYIGIISKIKTNSWKSTTIYGIKYPKWLMDEGCKYDNIIFTEEHYITKVG